MSEYRLATADPDGPVVHTPGNTNVPNDPKNREWMLYKFWLARGNVPDPYEPPPPPPAFTQEEWANVLEGKPPEG